MSLLEEIYDLSPEQGLVFYSELVDDQLIEVRQYEHYRWLQIGGDSLQGLMDIDSPAQLLLPNMQALMLSLLLCPEPGHVLNLGFGCGSIERFLNKHTSNTTITSIEPSQHVIKLAREYFFIGDDVEVISASAEAFLSKAESTYGIIFCDIFNNEAHPACLYDEHFYADIFSCLDKKGVLVMNLLPESEDDVVEILLAMKHYFGHVALLEIPNHFNAVIYASNERLPSTSVLDEAANTFYKQTALDLRDVPQRLNRLMERIET